MKVVILTMPIMTLAMNLTVMAVVWFGGQQILIGDMPVGNLTAFTTYVNADTDVAYDGFYDYDSGFPCNGIFSPYFGSVRYGH